ncbi:MAG: hypothetical protein ACREMJ_05770, partial [Gemmatimonadales bacterium]
FRPVPCDTLARPAATLGVEARLARAFAPTLRFAPGERYLPTIPFFTAWDGVDNDGNGPTDFADSLEVTLPGPGGAGPSWTALWEAYLGWPGPGPRPTAVFYRVCELTRGQAHQLVDFLKSDEQAWARLQIDHSLAPLLQDTVRIRVVQYYFYYVRDTGLQGHPQDIEMVFVLVPVDPAKARRFHVVVGSGHSDRVPNNVLVRFADYEGRPVVGPDLHVLVELGGHSSAPDRPPYGQFTPGLDANWHMYDVWGTRDAQAVGGTGFSGAYESEMTFVRDSLGAVTLYPHTMDLAAREKIYGGRPRAERDTTVYPYRLLPVLPFMRLSRALERRPPELDSVTRYVGEIEDALGTPGHARFATLDPAARAAAVRWMTAWNRDMRWKERGPGRHGKSLARAKHRIWDHQAYRGNPTDVFKAHLFRPTLNAIHGAGDVLRLLTWGAGGQPDDAFEVYAGFVVPAFRSYAIPVRLPGFLELQAGMYWPALGDLDRRGFSASLVWEHHRNAPLSWYNRVAWVPRRAEVLRDGEAADWILGAGVSVLPSIQRKSGALDPFNALRMRVGLRVDLKEWDDALRRVGWEVQLSFRQ